MRVVQIFNVKWIIRTAFTVRHAQLKKEALGGGLEWRGKLGFCHHLQQGGMVDHGSLLKSQRNRLEGGAVVQLEER